MVSQLLPAPLVVPSTMMALARRGFGVSGLNVMTSRLLQITLHHGLLFGGRGGDGGLGLGLGLDCNNQNFYQSKTIYKYFLNISFLSCFIFSGNSETKTPLEIRPPIDCSTSSHSVTIFCCISNGGSGI